MKTTLSFFAVLLFYVSIFSQQTEKTVMQEIPFSNIIPQKKTQSYFNFNECRQSYFKINLTSFDIETDKKFLTKYSPLAYIQVEMGSKKFIKIVGDESIQFYKENNKVSIRSIRNSPIIGYLPYTGEDVTITVSLYAYKTEDKIDDAIKIIKDITGLFPTQISPYLDITNKIYTNLNKLLSKSNNLISYQHTFNAYQDQILPNTFKEGYYIISKESNPLNPQNLKIYNLSILYNEKPITESKFDYIILNFDHTIKIPDYSKYQFYDKFKEALGYANTNKNTTAVELFYSDVLSKINANENITNYNKKLLHRYLYYQLMTVISKNDPDFVVNSTPDIDCFIGDEVAYMILDEDENRSEKQKRRDKNMQELHELKKKVLYDEEINSLLEKASVDPNTVIRQEDLLNNN